MLYAATEGGCLVGRTTGLGFSRCAAWRASNLASIAVSQEIQDEDDAICVSVQRGLRSGAYEAGRLSVRREAGEHLFHRLLHADLTAGLGDVRV